jgi:signal transduction histidine kinase
VRLLRGLSLRRKLSGIGMLSSLTALVSASVGFLVYERHTSRAAFTRRMLTAAEIVGFNCISPLLFDDTDAAAQTLAGLRAEPAVRAAVVTRAGGREAFASYAREAGAAPGLPAAVPASGGAVDHAFTGDRLLVTRPVVFEGNPIGRVVIEAELGELWARRRRYVLLALVILAGSFLLALAISHVVERTISRPLLRLADTARAVSSRDDYSVRVPVEGAGEAGDEIGTLLGTFNEMLERIQRQNSDLEEARAELEKRVEARTQDLAAANRELEAFSYSVSHDLRAPLRAIDGFSKALLASYEGQLDEKGRHYLQRVRAGTLRMAQLIDDLLSLARVSRRELVRGPIDVTDIAYRVGSELQGRHPVRKVAFEVVSGLRAEADAQLLTIVFENLIGNAWKFTSKRDDARIAVGGRRDGKATVFFVRDNGAGFDMQYADKLFGAFQRLHGDAEFEGTGIGLATVQRIVARHGGRIWAEGEPGRGAVFNFTLEPES